MLGGDVFVTHLFHRLLGGSDCLRELATCLRLRGRRTRSARQRDEGVAHGGADLLCVRAALLDEAANHTVFLTQQCVEQVERVHLRVTGRRSALNRVAQGLLSQCCEFLFHIILHQCTPVSRCCCARGAGGFVCLI